MRTILLILSVMALAGCSGRSQVYFDGKAFRTHLAKGEPRHVFTVTARPVSSSLTGARLAAEYEAIAYCVNDYGSSDIRWVIGPDSPDSSLPISDDTLTLQGACPQ